MVKIFLLAIAVWLVIIVLKRYLKHSENRTPEKPEPENMVQCAYCGVHLPTGDSLFVNNQYYCCEAHSNAAHTAPPKP